MGNEDVLRSIAELRRGSRATMLMVALGVIFLAATVLYSATRLRPLQEEVAAKRNEIAELEARRAELARIVAAAESAARPASPSNAPRVGWVYLGRVSGNGDWAPQSDRVKSATTPSAIRKDGVIEVQKNTTLVGEIEPEAKISSPEKPKGEPMLFIRPGTNLTVSIKSSYYARIFIFCMRCSRWAQATDSISTWSIWRKDSGMRTVVRA